MKKTNSALVILIITLFSCNLLSTEDNCMPAPWMTFKSDHLFKSPTSSNYIFSTSHKAFDADGAPNAYHPDNIGLDYLANAGYPNESYWKDVLVVDPLNPEAPYRQKDGDYAGYFIAKTALTDRSKAATDLARYVDSNKIPYLVFPGKFNRLKGTGKLGDYGIAINRQTKQRTAFVVADIGPSNAPLGEMSIALGEALGGKNINPKNGTGAPKGEIIYVMFPMSSNQHQWPQERDAFDSIANNLLKNDVGLVKMLECISK